MEIVVVLNKIFLESAVLAGSNPPFSAFFIGNYCFIIGFIIVAVAMTVNLFLNGFTAVAVARHCVTLILIYMNGFAVCKLNLSLVSANPLGFIIDMTCKKSCRLCFNLIALCVGNNAFIGVIHIAGINGRTDCESCGFSSAYGGIGYVADFINIVFKSNPAAAARFLIPLI